MNLPGLPPVAPHPGQRALDSTGDLQRGAQKISVASLVREDESDNLREKHRG